MFKQSTKDTINGWGSAFRFITPILLALVIFILTGMRDEIKDIRQTAKDLIVTTSSYNNNHLEHHRIFEIAICERLATIEAILKNKK